jgi:hypothetical protein
MMEWKEKRRESESEEKVMGYIFYIKVCWYVLKWLLLIERLGVANK